MQNYYSTLKLFYYNHPRGLLDLTRIECMYIQTSYIVSCGHLFWFTILAQHETNGVILCIHSVHKQRELFSTSKLQDEIKTEKFELNKFHASKKKSFLLMSFFLIIMLVKYTGTRIPDPPFSSFGPSCDYGMDLCLEVYLWTIYPYFTTFRVTTLSFY